MKKQMLTKNKQIDTSQMRLDILRIAFAAGNAEAHIGSALSLTEILATLYDLYSFGEGNSKKENTLILSKGHGIIAQYAVLAQLGVIAKNELDTYKKYNTRLFAHPTVNPEFGIDFATGSLGQGLSMGAGVALAYKYRNNLNAKVFVILGDGECNEGSVWEAAMFISSMKLNNLIVIIDRNKLQYDDLTENVVQLEPMADKWTAFGFNACTINGHNLEEIQKTLSNHSAQSVHEKKPLAIIANTIKGKGISFMENAPEWHNGYLKAELYERALKEIKES